MIALLRRLFAGHSCTSCRANDDRPATLLSLERLEDRVTPTTLSAFIGLTIAESHLYPPNPIYPPSPVAPAQFHAPVFALNYQFPPSPIKPLNALIGAFGHYPPSPIHSPVFSGVEAFLSGGTTIGGGT